MTTFDTEVNFTTKQRGNLFPPWLQASKHRNKQGRREERKKKKK